PSVLGAASCRRLHVTLDSSECLDHFRIELTAGLAAQFGHGLVGAPRGAIRPPGRHALPRVDDREDAGAERNLLSLEPARITGAVPALVVREDQLARRSEIFERADHLDAGFGMLPERVTLVVAERRSMRQAVLQG